MKIEQMIEEQAEMYREERDINQRVKLESEVLQYIVRLTDTRERRRLWIYWERLK